MKTISRRASERGILQMDLLAGLTILMLAIMPVGYSFARERQLLKIEYQRSVIIELVDGEMEILSAGAARGLPDGVQFVSISTPAMEKLPPGDFKLTKSGARLRLEWQPQRKCGFGDIAREAMLQ